MLNPSYAPAYMYYSSKKQPFTDIFIHTKVELGNVSKLKLTSTSPDDSFSVFSITLSKPFCNRIMITVSY